MNIFNIDFIVVLMAIKVPKIRKKKNRLALMLSHYVVQNFI
jgi:hypothetical protein